MELNESVQFAWSLRVLPASLIYKERLMMTTDRISAAAQQEERFVIFTDTNKKSWFPPTLWADPTPLRAMIMDGSNM